MEKLYGLKSDNIVLGCELTHKESEVSTDTQGNYSKDSGEDEVNTFDESKLCVPFSEMTNLIQKNK